MINQVQFILYVKNQEESTFFYEKILQRKPILNVPGMTEFILSENTKLGLMPNDGIAKIISKTLPHPNLGVGIPRCELYLYIENLKSLYFKIKTLNVQIVSELSNRDWGDNAFYIADLDGHIIAFAEKIKS